jgi:hypothetical protein
MPSKTLAEAIAKAHEPPEADQERIGREPNDYINHLRALRSDIDEGLRSLDAGLGQKLDMEDNRRARVNLRLDDPVKEVLTAQG